MDGDEGLDDPVPVDPSEVAVPAPDADPQLGGSAPDDSDGETIADVTVEAIRESATAVADRQTERALAEFDDRGALSAEQRAAVDRLAERLVAAVLAVPERALRSRAEEVDEETLETARELFE